jgi:prevent-host-death family protein
VIETTIVTFNAGAILEPTMKRVGVRELKAHLSEYLTKVKAGEEVIVTERGKSVAKLIPWAPTESSDAEWERLRELERRGLVRMGTGKIPEGFWDMPRPNYPEGLCVKFVL